MIGASSVPLAWSNLQVLLLAEALVLQRNIQESVAHTLSGKSIEGCNIRIDQARQSSPRIMLSSVAEA